MSYISLYFILFVFVLIGLYYLVPMKHRYLVLLAGSLVFYCMNGWRGLVYVLASFLAAYFSALMMEKVYESGEGDAPALKKKAKAYFIPGLAVILILLIFTKSIRFMPESFRDPSRPLGLWLFMPLGMSYYSFGIMGYMADVLWRRDKAERNPLKLLLYMIYFPQIVEGPIPRHSELSGRLSEGHEFDFGRICSGLQRALWGFFKKLVIADRCSVLVGSIFDVKGDVSGLLLPVGVLLSAVMLYADFSGCMDIALGVSQCFGVTLAENFRRPFFSTTVAGFWRRWHITLGTWFRDYVCMPVTISAPVKKLSKKVRRKYGADAGRNTTTAIALIITWICTGLWHGTGIGYLIWGCYWGTLMVVSSVFEKQLIALRDRLHIDGNAPWYRYFCMVRTLLFFCGGRFITQAGSIGRMLELIGKTFSVFNPWVFFDGTFYDLGLPRTDVGAMVFGIVILTIVSLWQERNEALGLGGIREAIASCPLPVRWVIYMTAIFIVMIFGYYGAGFDAASFAYMKF